MHVPTAVRRTRASSASRALTGLCIAAFSFSSLGGSIARAEEETSPPPRSLDELDQRLTAAFKESHLPGAAFVVIENGRVALAKGYGVADSAKNTPVTPDTVLRAGSISKSFVGIGVMMLVEDHALTLDARLSDLAPEVSFRNPWETTDPIRLVHLLEHTTGWPDVSMRDYTMDGRGWSVLRGVQESSVNFVSGWRPGTYSVYCNAGPAVAGYVIEKISGQSFAAFERERVLRPLGMANADFDLPPALEAQLAKSYEPGGAESPFEYIILPPAGSLSTSARELSNLVLFFLNRGTIDGRRLLSEGSIDRIERQESSWASRLGLGNGYGLGNAPLTDEGVTFRGHNGSIDAFTAVYGYTRTNGSGYVVMANGGDGVDFRTPVTRLIQGYLTRDSRMAVPPEYARDPRELDVFSGVYRQIAPATALTRPFVEMLGLSWVAGAGSKLRIGGRDFVPTGPHTFRRFDRDEPSLAFVVAEDGVFKLSGGFGQARKEPVWRVVVIAVTAASLVLGATFAVLMLPFWIRAALRGRLKGGLLVRVLPLAAVAALAATFGLPLACIAASGTAAVTRLASPGLYSITILILSLLFPLLGAAAFAFALRSTQTGRFVRSYAAVVAVAVLVAAAYASQIGWIGLRTWTI